MKKTILLCLLTAALGGCKSTPRPPTDYLKALNTCKPLTYECHAKVKTNIMSEGFGKAMVKVFEHYSRDDDAHKAIKGMLALNADSPFDRASKHRYLAMIMIQSNDFQGALKHVVLALETPVLNARDYIDLLVLEIDTHFELEQYELVKQKIENYFAYAANEDHAKQLAQLAYIAKIQNDSNEYDRLIAKIKNNDEALEHLKKINNQRLKHTPPAVKNAQLTPAAVVRVEPEYPEEAVKNGVHGWVKFQYDLTPQGKPTNIKITESHPVGMFDQAGVNALKKWLYRVKLDENGQVINGQGLTLQLDWRMR